MKNSKFDNLYKKIYFSSIIKEENEKLHSNCILDAEKIGKFFHEFKEVFLNNFKEFLKNEIHLGRYSRTIRYYMEGDGKNATSSSSYEKKDSNGNTFHKINFSFSPEVWAYGGLSSKFKNDHYYHHFLDLSFSLKIYDDEDNRNLNSFEWDYSLRSEEGYPVKDFYEEKSKKLNSFGKIVESSQKKRKKKSNLIDESGRFYSNYDLPGPGDFSPPNYKEADELPLSDFHIDYDDDELENGGIPNLDEFLNENPAATIYDVIFKKFVDGLNKVMEGKTVEDDDMPAEMFFFTEENLKKLPGMNDSFVKTFKKD